MTHIYRWGKYIPAWKGRFCRILSRGKMNSILIEFDDGTRAITSRYAVRRLTPVSVGESAQIGVDG